MEQQSTSGGSKSTDFQPTTGNPQSNVNGSLQPNSANLQPATTSSGINVFNQPGVNSQAFPQTDSLKVLSTGSRSNNSNLTVARNDTPGNGFLTIFIVSVVVTVIVILAVAKIAKPIRGAETIVPEEPSATTVRPKSMKKRKNKSKKSKKRNK